MEIGLFLMPAHPPERSLYDATQWDLDLIQLADELGYVEAWVASTSRCRGNRSVRRICCWLKRCCGPRTSSSLPARICCPITIRWSWPIGWPTSITSRRAALCSASAPVAYRGDWALFDVDGQNGEHREMTREALEIMLKVWTEDQPWEFRGKYWNANGIAPMFEG